MNRHDHEQMLSLYKQWQASGKSKTDFAVSQGVRPTTFYYWTKKFDQSHLSEGQSELRPNGSGFSRICVEETPCSNLGELMAAVQYPSGIRLELYSSFHQLNHSYVELLKTLTQ